MHFQGAADEDRCLIVPNKYYISDLIRTIRFTKQCSFNVYHCTFYT